MHNAHAWLQVYGFLDGPHGIYSGEYIELTAEVCQRIACLTFAAEATVPRARPRLDRPCMGGPTEDVSLQRIAPYRNQGGFDMIGSGRHKIETEEQCVLAAWPAPTCRTARTLHIYVMR